MNCCTPPNRQAGTSVVTVSAKVNRYSKIGSSESMSVRIILHIMPNDARVIKGSHLRFAAGRIYAERGKMTINRLACAVIRSKLQSRNIGRFECMIATWQHKQDSSGDATAAVGRDMHRARFADVLAGRSTQIQQWKLGTGPFRVVFLRRDHRFFLSVSG